MKQKEENARSMQLIRIEAPIYGITMSKWLFMHENFVQQPDDTLAGILFLK